MGGGGAVGVEASRAVPRGTRNWLPLVDDMGDLVRPRAACVRVLKMTTTLGLSFDRSVVASFAFFNSVGKPQSVAGWHCGLVR
jgi:hypothetical protein